MPSATKSSVTKRKSKSTIHNHAFFADLNCPNKVTWTADIQKMFTSLDVDHMKQATGGALDLSKYASVKIWASQIFSHVSPGSTIPMPPPGSGEGPWTPDMVNAVKKRAFPTALDFLRPTTALACERVGVSGSGRAFGERVRELRRRKERSGDRTICGGRKTSDGKHRRAFA